MREKPPRRDSVAVPCGKLKLGSSYPNGEDSKVHEMYCRVHGDNSRYVVWVAFLGVSLHYQAVMTGKGMYTIGAMEHEFWILYPLTSVAIGAVVRFWLLKHGGDSRWLLWLNLIAAIFPAVWFFMAPFAGI